MGSQTKKKTIQNTVAGGLLIATGTVSAKGGGAGTTEGGKNQLGVNHLSLEQSPGRNAIVCADPNANAGKGGTNIMPNDITLAIDPFAKGQIALEFIVRDIIAHNQDYILILAYSSHISPSPQVPTPISTKKLQLDINRAEVIAIMNIPAQQMLPQGATRLGAADPTPHSAVTLSINLSKQTLPTFINQNEKAYFQAALVPKTDFQSGNIFEYMILSELDTVGFLENECAAGSSTISAGNDDGMSKGGSPVQTPDNVNINNNGGNTGTGGGGK
jgi:hypothetical protein